MDEDGSVVARGYGFGYDTDGTEWLTELTWRPDGCSVVIVLVRLRLEEQA